MRGGTLCRLALADALKINLALRLTPATPVASLQLRCGGSLSYFVVCVLD